MLRLLTIIDDEIPMTRTAPPPKKNSLRPVHPVEVLREDYLKPLGLLANALALALRVPASRINDIVLERRSVTVDTAMRLTRYFRRRCAKLDQSAIRLRHQNCRARWRAGLSVKCRRCTRRSSYPGLLRVWRGKMAAAARVSLPVHIPLFHFLRSPN